MNVIDLCCLMFGLTAVDHRRTVRFRERDRDSSPRALKPRTQFLKRHTVFHISQIDGLPEDLASRELEAPAKLDDAGFNLWVDNTGADIHPGAGKAAYMPALDIIGRLALGLLG